MICIFPLGVHPSLKEYIALVLTSKTVKMGRFAPENLPICQKSKVYSKPFWYKKSETGDFTNFLWLLLGLLSDSILKTVKQ